VNILVFVKQVADSEAKIIIKADNKSLEIENKYTLNFFDEFAIEEAIKIKEKFKDSQITVCTYGSKRSIEALRTAIAMGADRAFLIDNAQHPYENSIVVATILASFAEKEGFDIILCGRQAMDDENAHLGSMIAEFLSIPHISAILKLEIIDGKKARVENEIEGGRAIIEVALPALFTTQKGLNEPRVPLITGVMKAMKANIPLIDPFTLGILKEDLDSYNKKIKLFSYELPAKRPPVKIIEGETPEEKVNNLIKILKDEAKAL